MLLCSNSPGVFSLINVSAGLMQLPKKQGTINLIKYFTVQKKKLERRKDTSIKNSVANDR